MAPPAVSGLHPTKHLPHRRLGSPVWNLGFGLAVVRPATAAVGVERMAKAEARSDGPTLPVHGALVLPSVLVDTYACELEDEEGFVGNKASKSAFHEILDRVRSVSQED